MELLVVADTILWSLNAIFGVFMVILSLKTLKSNKIHKFYKVWLKLILAIGIIICIGGIKIVFLENNVKIDMVMKTATIFLFSLSSILILNLSCKDTCKGEE